MRNQSLPATVLALGGGKGGTGKSLLAVQMGIILAQSGLRTILVDADPNGANLHTFFGLEDPERSLDEVVQGTCQPEDAVWPTGVAQLHLLPGLREGLSSSLSGSQRLNLMKMLRTLDTDVLLWDVGSGMRDWSTHFFSSADIGLMVSTPEAIAMERDYRFLRKVCRWALGEEVTEKHSPPDDWLPGPWLAQLQQTDEKLAKHCKERLQQQRLLWVLNRMRTPEDRDLGHDIVSVCQRFLGVHGEFLGWLEYDERIWLSLRQRRPMVLEFPESRWTHQVHQIVKDLLPVLLKQKP